MAEGSTWYGVSSKMQQQGGARAMKLGIGVVLLGTALLVAGFLVERWTDWSPYVFILAGVTFVTVGLLSWRRAAKHVNPKP